MEEMTREQLMAEVEALRNENANLKNRKRTLSLKVAEKTGALSLYGISRLPVSMYAEQWQRVLDFSDQIREFIANNTDKLSWKNKENK